MLIYLSLSCFSAEHPGFFSSNDSPEMVLFVSLQSKTARPSRLCSQKHLCLPRSTFDWRKCLTRKDKHICSMGKTLFKTPIIFGFSRKPQMDAPLADLQCPCKGGGRLFGLCRMLISQSKTKGRLEKKMLRNKEDNTFLTFFSFWQS